MIDLDGQPTTRDAWALNALLAVSLAAAQAAAIDTRRPLFQHLVALGTDKTRKPVMPLPMMNIINGGAHAPTTRSTCRSS